MQRKSEASKGVVLILDVAIAMLVLIAAIAMAYSTYDKPSYEGFDSQLVRAYLQDAATLMAIRGDFSQPISSTGNTSQIREIFRALPPTVCMQVSGHGIVVPEGLLSYWKLDEDSGATVLDSSGNMHFGIAYGGSFSHISKDGRSFHLDGRDYIDFGSDSSFNLAGSGTVSLWFRADNFTSSDYPHLIGKGHDAVCKGDGWSIYLSQSGDLGVCLTNGEASNTLSASGQGQTGVWKHVAATWNGSDITLYINGMKHSTAIQTVQPNSEGKMLMIGRWQNSMAGFFNGYIDEVRIYNRALNESEIQMVYSNPSNILYVINKPECTFASKEVQSLIVPFVLNHDQDKNKYYYAVIKAWSAGVK